MYALRVRTANKTTAVSNEMSVQNINFFFFFLKCTDLILIKFILLYSIIVNKPNDEICYILINLNRLIYKMFL